MKGVRHYKAPQRVVLTVVIYIGLKIAIMPTHLIQPSSMPVRSRYRTMICLSLVLLIHCIIFTALNLKHDLRQRTEPVSSTVWIIPETKLHKPVALPKSDKSRITTYAMKSNTTITSIPQQLESHPEPVAEPTLPPLDLDGLRANAVQQEISRERSPIEILNEARLRNRSLEVKVENAANQAQRPDCRTAHSGAGLFAPLMIAADLIRDKGCKF